MASHYDDAGPILPEDVERLHRAQGPAASTSTSAPIHSTTNQPSAPSTDANRSPSESTGAPHAAESEQQRRARERVALQAAIMEGVQAIYSGMEAVTRGTEAVERELDSLLEALAARTPQPPSKPPASKKAVANLPQVVLTAGKLDEVGRCVLSLAFAACMKASG